MKLGDLIKSRSWWRSALLLAAVMGPGVITANVDNDAGGITTYTLAGAQYGYSLLWSIPLMAVILSFAQILAARMGVATGKGLAELTRENCGLKTTFYVMLLLMANDYGNMVANFAGVAAAGELFHIPKYLSVPAAAAFIWWLVTQGDYKRIERVFLAACLFYLSYVLSSYLVHPRWSEVLRAVCVPHVEWSKDYWLMLLGLLGATVAPWQMYLQQAMIVDKGIKTDGYWMARLDAVVGSVASMLVVLFIIVACAVTLHTAGIHVENASQAALALRPLAGEWCSALFAFGLLNASVIAASILALSATYSVCGAMGWEMGLDLSYREAPQFYYLYTLLIGSGALIILWPGFPLIRVMFWTQVLNGVVLPVVLFLCLYLSDSKEVMGDLANSGPFRVAAWTLVIVISLLSAGTLLMYLAT